jgi:trans-aconitate 2-methyltransferase
LQWVPDHERLVPRLFDALAPGGVLAVQMPDNLDEPSHQLMRETAASGPWSGRLAQAAASRTRILPLADYYDLLAPHGAHVDVWRTVYHHPMDTPGAIVEWLRSTGLKPFVDPLPADEQAGFLTQYGSRVAQAYPPRSDGRRLLSFPRVFIVARRKS